MSEAPARSVEARLQRIEDQLAIYQVVASYGPAVDSVSPAAVSALWAADGVYDVGGQTPYRGAEDVGALVHGERHQTYVAAGCGHILSLPAVVIDGDLAVATNHSRVYCKQDDEWKVVRLSANRWELARSEQGWRVTHRSVRLLDGSTDAQDLLHEGLPDA